MEKSIATISVFSELCDNDKTINEMINSLIIYELKNTNDNNFTLSEITKKINSFYNFNLPKSVIKTRLKRLDFIELNYGNYTVKGEFPEINNLINISNAKKRIQSLFESFYSYYETKKKIKLNDMQKEEVKDEFCSFLFYNNNHEGIYSPMISSFIIENKNNEYIQKTLDNILVGIIIYNGITSDFDFSTIECGWKSEIALYLDVEILFNICGYNGEYYETLGKNFLDLVNSINKTIPYIHLKYFEKTKNEISSFFSASSSIITQKKSFDTTKTAMSYIVNKCKTKSDVILLEKDFFTDLSKKGITLDSENYYDLKYHKYNIENKSDSIDEKLNYINILRKGINNNKFSEIKYLLISDTSSILQKAILLKNNNNYKIPLAVHLDEIITKFWFAQNKGFGTKSNLEIDSLTAYNRARVALSGLLSDKLSSEYNKLLNKYDKKDKNNEQILTQIAALRDAVKKPEDIAPENASNNLFILEQDFEALKNDKDILKSKISVKNKEIEILKNKLQESEEIRDSESIRLSSLEKKIEKFELIEKEKKEKKEKCLSKLKWVIKILGVPIFIFLLFQLFILKENYIFLNFIFFILSIFISIFLDRLLPEKFKLKKKKTIITDK